MKSPPPIALFLALFGIAVLCSLGMWQLQRLEWKNNLQTQLDKAYDESRRLPALSARDVKDEDFTFKRGIIKGRYIPGQNFLVGPRTFDGKPGAHFYGAFRMNDGSIVFVNRGWVPQDFTFFGDDRRRMPRQALTGLFKKPPQANRFTPDNDPQAKQWYHPDLQAMAAIADISSQQAITNYLFILEDDNSKSFYPVKSAVQIELRNQHLQYAVFWFMMALVLAAMFYMRFMRVPSILRRT